MAVDLNRSASTHTTVMYPAASGSLLSSSTISKVIPDGLVPFNFRIQADSNAAPQRIGLENLENASTRGNQT